VKIPPHLHVRNVSFSSSTKATVIVNGLWYVITQWQVVTRLNLVLHTPVCPPLKPEDVPPSLNPIPNTYSEAHFLPMLPHATRRDDVAGNKQVLWWCSLRSRSVLTSLHTKCRLCQRFGLAPSGTWSS